MFKRIRIRHVTYNCVKFVRILSIGIFGHACISYQPYCSVPNIVLTTCKQRHILVVPDYVIESVMCQLGLTLKREKFINFRYLKLNFRYLKFNFRYLKFNFRYLKLNFRYLKLNFRYLKFNFRYLKFNFRYPKLFADI